MTEIIIALLYAIVAIVLSVFLISRLRINNSKVAGSIGFFYSGLILIVVSTLINLLSTFPDYAAWFLPGVYPVVSSIIALLLIGGIVLAAIGLLLHFSYWDDRDIEVANHLDKLRLIDNIQQDSHYPYPLLELLDRVLKNMLGGLGEEAGAIFLLDNSKRKFILATGSGLTKEETALLEYYPYERNIVTQAIEEQAPLITSDFRSLGGKAQLAASKFRSILIVPLLSGKNRLGAMLLFSQEERHFTKEQLSIMSPISEWLSEKIEVNRLKREMSKNQRDLERKADQLGALSSRLKKIISYNSETPTPSEFVEKTTGLFGSESAWLVGLSGGRLAVYGGSDGEDNFSDNYKAAIVNALNRKKPVILNQESNSADGQNYISKSSLLFPAGNGQAVLLRKAGSVFTVSDNDLLVLEIIARIGSMVIANARTGLISHSRGRGVKLISDVLQQKITKTRHDKIVRSLLSKIEEILADNFIVMLLKRDRDSYRQVYDSVGTDLSDPIVISAGEGSTGKTAALRSEAVLFGTKEVTDNIADYSDSNRELLLHLFGERSTPAYQGDFPIIIKDQTEFVVVAFGFNNSPMENMEWHRLLSLLFSLLNLRFEISLAEISDSKPAVAIDTDTAPLIGQIGTLNNSLAEISSRCQLAQNDPNLSGDISRLLESIILKVEESAGLLNEVAVPASLKKTDIPEADDFKGIIGTYFNENRISGNLHMIDGHPITVDLRLDFETDLKVDGKSIRALIVSVGKLIAVELGETDRMTVSLYDDGDLVYLDIVRVSGKQTVVRKASEFALFAPPESYTNNRMIPSELLKAVAEIGGELAVDNHSETPMYYSCRMAVSTSIEKVMTPSTYRQVSILAVDDQAIILDLLAAMCQSLGYKIYTAHNGQEGLRLFESFKPDIVISDLAMPVMSGWELAAKVKSLSPQTPVIIITGWGVSVDEERMAQIGVDHILHKPFRLEQLSDIIKQVRQSHIIQ